MTTPPIILVVAPHPDDEVLGVLLWKDYWDYETLRRGAPPDWEERLMAADVSAWLYDATGTA